VKAARFFAVEDRPMVCLATAHPAKFGDAVARATGVEPALPPALAALLDLESRCEVLAADLETVKGYVAGRAL